MKTDELKDVHAALCQFIINTSKVGAPGYAVQALPEAVNSLIQLTNLLKTLK